MFIKFNTPYNEIGDRILKYYNIFCQENFDKNPVVYSGFSNFLKTIYETHEQEFVSNISEPLIPTPHRLQDNNKLLIGFSGGLDSAYSALDMRDKGYDVTLFHCTGLNKHFPKEDICARQFAEAMDFEFVEVPVEHGQKEFFIDNPIKNQLIMSYMIDYCFAHGIGRVMLGSDLTTKIEDSTIGMTITDSSDVYYSFISGIQLYVDNLKVHFISSDMPKHLRIQYILLFHPEALEYIYSCISPHRFSNHLKELNEKKYGITLLKDRCGSCYKCCMEYILLYECGYYTDQVFLDHCYDVLSKSKNAHRKDLFSKKIPLEERRQSILNYMS